MQKKNMISIFVCMLLIATALPVVGNVEKNYELLDNIHDVLIDPYDQLDQYQTESWGCQPLWFGCYGDSHITHCAQGFTPTLEILTRVELDILRFGDVPDYAKVIVSIRNTLTGSDLTSISINKNEVSYDPGSWIEFDFPDIEVTPGEKYFIIFTSNYVGTSDYFAWWFAENDLYKGGHRWRYDDGYLGHGWEKGVNYGDYCFKTYGKHNDICIDYMYLSTSKDDWNEENKITGYVFEGQSIWFYERYFVNLYEPQSFQIEFELDEEPFVDGPGETSNGPHTIWGGPWKAVVGDHTIKCYLDCNGDVIEYDEGNNVDSLNFEVKVNSPPNDPTVSFEELTEDAWVFKMSAIDPDGHKVRFGLDYEGYEGPDYNVDEYTDYYDSGEEAIIRVNISYIKDNYINVIAQNELGLSSGWSYCKSKTKPYFNTPFIQFLQNFLNSHPNLFPILQRILLQLGLQ